MQFLKLMGDTVTLTERILTDGSVSTAEKATVLQSMRIIPTRTFFRPFATFDPIQTLEKILNKPGNLQHTASAQKVLDHFRAQKSLLRASSANSAAEKLLRPAGSTDSESDSLLRAADLPDID